MKQTTSRAVRDALKYINETYRFMLERGYEVFSAEDYDLGWQVVLRKPDLFVRILRTRGDEYVSFRTSTQPPDEFIDIGSVVYAATGEKIPISYGSYSKELQQYLDKIETYIEGGYVRNADSLRVAQKEYRETLPPVEVISPKRTRDNTYTSLPVDGYCHPVAFWSIDYFSYGSAGSLVFSLLVGC